jgi:hypothetical protein
MDKSQIRTKKDNAKYAKVWALSERYDEVTHSRPLLIVRLSNLKPGLPNTMRPVRKRPYQDYTFALCIPLELDGDNLDLLKLDYLSWLRLLGEVLRIAPPYFTMGETLVEISSHVH